MAGTRHVGFGFEVTEGTPVASTHFVEGVTESIQDEREFEEVQTIRSNSTRDVVQLKAWSAGDVEAVSNYQDLAHWFYMMLGSVDTTGVGPYTHTLPASTGIADRPAVTVEVERDNDTQTWRYPGCILNTLTITQGLDGSGRVTGNFKGRSSSTGTSTTPTFPDFDVVLPTQATVSFDGGSTTFDATQFELTISYPTDDPFVLGSATFGATQDPSDVLSVTLSVEALFDGMTEYNNFDGSTDVDVQLVMNTGGDEVATINLNNTRMTQGTPHLDGRQRLTTTYNLTSYFDTTATENIQAVIVNDESTVP